jgi:pimeloyl-ACP methyl ester carboxylesterase
MASAERSEGTTVVLVHALGSSRRAWTPQIEALSNRHRVLAPDLPGHGQAKAPFTLDRAVESVHSTISQSAEKAHVVGISVGAVVALLTCLEHPAEVASLVLSGGLAHPPRWLVLQRVMTQITPEPLFLRASVGMYSGGRSEYANAAAEDLRRCGKHTLLVALRELARLDLRPRLSQVAAPTLVLCGSKDRPSIPLSRELAAGIPAADLKIVGSAIHLWNLQQPEEFNRTVSTFLERTASHGG